MIFRLAPDTKSSCFQAWKQDAHKLAKRGWVEDRDSFRGASGDVVCIDTRPRNRAFPNAADLIDPEALLDLLS